MNIRNLIVSTGVMFALVMTSFPAYADNNKNRSYRESAAVYDYAQVLSAKPIVRYVTVETPVRECWEDTEYYTVNNSRPSSNPVGSTIIGALIGGVVGNQFGDGRGRDAMTVVGTIVGAAAGSDNAKRSQYSSSSYQTSEYSRPVQRCSTNVNTHQEERIDGYRVVYVYNGQRYATKTQQDPGNQIRIRISVTPAM